MEIEMPRPEAEIEVRFVSAPRLNPKSLSAPGSSGLPPAALLPRATRIAVWFPGVVRI
jgi:hypothetical protein